MNNEGVLNPNIANRPIDYFLQHRFSLHPAQSLVLNIGHDGSGEHCSEVELSQHLSPIPVKVVDLPIESPRQLVQKYYQKMYPSSGLVISSVKAFFLIIKRMLNKFWRFLAYLVAAFVDK